MTDAPIIDADTHVDETEDTWEFIEPGEEPLKPVSASPANPDPKSLVSWGEQSWEEMMIGFYDIVIPADSNIRDLFKKNSE